MEINFHKEFIEVLGDSILLKAPKHAGVLFLEKCLIPNFTQLKPGENLLVDLDDEYGFPKGKPKAMRIVKGFQTGDIVKAIVPKGKYKGVYVGRVIVRSSGSFDIAGKTGRAGGINHKYCTPLHKTDGYSYNHKHYSSPRINPGASLWR